jgi:hypothetical protein
MEDKARAYEQIHTLMEPDDMVEEIYNSRETIEELENKMSIANNKLKKIEEYITAYESISTIQGLNDTNENKNLDKNTMVEMTNRYLKVHDKILSIIEGND